MKKFILIALVLCLLGIPDWSVAQEADSGVWKDTSPVYACQDTSQGTLIMEFDSLPVDYKLPPGWYYRVTLPDIYEIVAYHQPVIVAGVVDFGFPIFVSPLFVGNFVTFETFYFREFRSHWHSCWRAHPHWKHFDSHKHSGYAKHRSPSLANKLSGHKGYKADNVRPEKLAGKGAPLSTKTGKAGSSSPKAGAPGSGPSKVSPGGKKDVRPPRPPDATKGGKAPAAVKKPGETRPPKSSPDGNVPGGTGDVRPPRPSGAPPQGPGSKSPTMRGPSSGPPQGGMRSPQGPGMSAPRSAPSGGRGGGSGSGGSRGGGGGGRGNKK